MRGETAPARSGHELAQAARITYRQADYWTDRGWLTPLGDPHPGSSGDRDAWRVYPPEMVERARLLGRLTRLGIPVGLAAHLLDDRTIDPDGGWVARLDDGLTVVSEP